LWLLSPYIRSLFKEHRAPVKRAGDIHRRNLGWHDGARVSRVYVEKKGQVIGLDEWAGVAPASRSLTAFVERLDFEFMSDFYQVITKQRNDSSELRTCMERTVEELLACETGVDRPGMLLGKIQSGKTRAFIGIMALAFDKDYDIAIILTKAFS
jgi:hypothetical protein